MKALLAALILSVSVNAQFSDIEAITCDGLEVEVKEGDRLFFDPVKSIIGFGETSEDGCKVVDFKTLLLEQSTSVGEDIVSTYLPVSAVGRKTTCQPGQISDYKGPVFEKVTIEDEKITIKKFEGCDLAIITLKK